MKAWFIVFGSLVATFSYAYTRERHSFETTHFSSFKRSYLPYEAKTSERLRRNLPPHEAKTLLNEKIQRAHALFRSFFEGAPSLQINSPRYLHTWVNLSLEESGSMDPIVRLSERLETETGYRATKYIYVLLAPDASLTKANPIVLRVAPILFKGGVDQGMSKHVALAKGKSVLAAGELSFKKGTPSQLTFDLHSGSYMHGLNPEVQKEISQETKNWFQSWLGATWLVEHKPCKLKL